MRLEGKTVIITGASSGIGAAAARLFASEGAALVLGARREALLAELVRDIQARGAAAVALAGDVRDEACAAALVRLALDRFGRLDAAFNNAGTMGELAPIPEMTTDNWQDVIRTNLSSAFFAARAQVPAMQQQGGGSIVFTSSFVGHTRAGLAGMGAYAASKAGLIGLVKSLAVEHAADGIRVNALLPGGTRTAMAGDDPAVQAYIASLHPMGRIAEPEEIAEAALFLLSGESSFVTGSAMLADGGVSVQLDSGP